MSRLFVKIFLGFWLAMLIGAGSIIVMLRILEPSPLVARWYTITRTAIAYYSQTAAEVYDRDGKAGVAALFDRIERDADIHLYLFDSQGRELSGRAPSPEALALSQRALASGNYEYGFGNNRTLAAQYANGAREENYLVVGDMPRGRLGMLATPGPWIKYLLAFLLATGVVCYLLVRYLTDPLIKLRGGVRRLAAGDVKVRVSGRIGSRYDELADLARDFDVMADRIESLIMAQQRLLGDISHELRSPLTRLNLSLAIARQLAGTTASAEHDRIEIEVGRINTLIDQLLTLTRLESGAEKVDEEQIDLEQLVSETAADADFEARSYNRSVRVLRSEPCSAPGSRLLLRSAIENIIRNAVRHTRKETVVEITVGCANSLSDSETVITVRDHGPGVPEDSLKDIFLPFYRAAEARDRQSGGVGLGLAITERAVRLHGGKVKAANTPEGGLLVEIRLPGSSTSVCANSSSGGQKRKSA
jgi:two-component system, OmpR family, sensor histidine kinase CpxA